MNVLKLGQRAGWFPIRIEALPEGTCVHAHVPVYQVPRMRAVTDACSLHVAHRRS